MNTLDPTADTGLGFTRPIQEPDLFGQSARNLGNMATDLFGVFLGDGAEEDEGSGSVNQGPLRAQLIRRLQSAQLVREQRGDAQGMLLARQAVFDFGVAGGKLNEETQRFVSEVTGQPLEFQTRTAEEVSFEGIMNTAEGRARFLAVRANNFTGAGVYIWRIKGDAARRTFKFMAYDASDDRDLKDRFRDSIECIDEI